MALIKCPDCHSNVSTLAKSCPKCGFPISNDQMKSRIGIPAIPEEIYQGLKKAALKNMKFLRWKVRVGEWVKENQVLAEYSVKSFKEIHGFRGKIRTIASINAPISGIISKINLIEYSKWDWNDLILSDSSLIWNDKNTELQHLKDENILVYIDTPKSLENLFVPSAGKAYTNITEYGYFARGQGDANLFLNFWGYFKGSSFEAEDFLEKYLIGLSISDLRAIKLTD